MGLWPAKPLFQRKSLRKQLLLDLSETLRSHCTKNWSKTSSKSVCWLLSLTCMRASRNALCALHRWVRKKTMKRFLTFGEKTLRGAAPVTAGWGLANTARPRSEVHRKSYAENGKAHAGLGSKISAEAYIWRGLFSIVHLLFWMKRVLIIYITLLFLHLWSTTVHS